MGLFKKIKGITGVSDYSSETVKSLVIDATGNLYKRSYGSQLDIADDVIYVSPSFTETGQFYSSLSNAFTYANNVSNGVKLVIIYPGEYTGNFTSSVNTYAMKGVIFSASSNASPTLTVNKSFLGYADFNTVPSSADTIVVNGDSNGNRFECNSTPDVSTGSYSALKISNTGSYALYVKIHSGVGSVNITGNQEIELEAERIYSLNISNSTRTLVRAKVLRYSLNVTAGNSYIDIERYESQNTKIVTVVGGDLVINGRVDNYSQATNNVTGAGYVIQITSGTVHVHDFYAKNGTGDVIWGEAGANLIIAHSVLESHTMLGGVGGNTIYGGVAFTATYSGTVGLNTATGGGLTEVVAGNKTVNAGIII